MQVFKFKVSLCCGEYANGLLAIEAENSEDAYNKACDKVSEKLAEAFPTLDIIYDVEPVAEYNKEELENYIRENYKGD